CRCMVSLCSSFSYIVSPYSPRRRSVFLYFLILRVLFRIFRIFYVLVLHLLSQIFQNLFILIDTFFRGSGAERNLRGKDRYLLLQLGHYQRQGKYFFQKEKDDHQENKIGR